MINNLIPLSFSESDIEDLKLVNPYWNKDLNKYIKNANIWTTKFKGENSAYTIPFFNSNEGLIDNIRKVNEYRNFIKQRYDIIRTNMRFVRKFNKFLINYLVIYGILSSVKTIANYMRDVKEKDIAKKEIHFVKLTNVNLEKWFELFKNKAKTAIKHDEYIKLIFNEVLFLDEKIVSFEGLIIQVSKYSQRLFKKKKITESQVVEIMAESLEFMTLTNCYSYYTSLFIDKIAY